MGLDVYLRKCPDLEYASKQVEAFQEAETKEWASVGKQYETLTEAEKAEIKVRISSHAKEYGYDEVNYDHKSVSQIERDSSLYPKHMFKVGYFRSSYNEGGLNSYLRRHGIGDLYAIFDANDHYKFKPDWDRALVRVKEAIAAYKKSLNGIAGNLDAFSVGKNIFGTPKGVSLPSNATEALAVAAKELESRAAAGAGGFDSYSNGYGNFFLKGIEVVAVLPGTSTTLKKHDCAYVVYRRKGSDEQADDDNWYLQALEVVQETIEFVLAQPDKDQYYFHWSS